MQQPPQPPARKKTRVCCRALGAEPAPAAPFGRYSSLRFAWTAKGACRGRAVQAKSALLWRYGGAMRWKAGDTPTRETPT